MEKIEWGNQENITAQFKSMADFMETDYMERYAKNFGQLHLMEAEVNGWNKYEVHNIFVVSAEAQYNYGLDFKMFIHYTSKGVKFLKELRTGGKGLSSAPLKRVFFNTTKPEGFSYEEENTLEVTMAFMENIKNDIYESFKYSMNVGYKKDLKVRHLLREASQENDWTFA